MAGHLNSKMHNVGVELVQNAVLKRQTWITPKQYHVKVFVKAKPYIYKGEDVPDEAIFKGDPLHGINEEALDKAIDWQIANGQDVFIAILDILNGEVYGDTLDTLLKRGIDWTDGGRRIRMWGSWMFSKRLYKLSPDERELMRNLAIDNQAHKDQMRLL